MNANKRWCIYADIEGFSIRYANSRSPIPALSSLMEGIFKIGPNYMEKYNNRIFAHQTGDGFAIVSGFGTESLELPIAISIALSRHVAATRNFIKASIGEGDFADITGLYPRQITDLMTDNRTVPMGKGLMTIFPVMGTALIDSVDVMKSSPKGALLTLSSRNDQIIPALISRKSLNNNDIIAVDWIHSEMPSILEIQKISGLSIRSPNTLEDIFLQYIDEFQIEKNWIENTKLYCNISK